MTQLAAAELQVQLKQIQEAMAAGQVLQAELGSLRLLEQLPDCVPALVVVAQCAAARDDQQRAAAYWRRAWQARPLDEGLLYQLAITEAGVGNLIQADEALARHWQSQRKLSPENWLLWGHIKQRMGADAPALKAWFRAVEQAQRQGRWVNEASTPPELRPMVLSAMRQLSRGRAELFQASIEPVRRECGSASLARVERALANYLGQSRDGPSDSRQRPKFLYIPGLPDVPFHDPHLQPWAGRLEDAYQVIKDEALGLLSDRGVFESFLTFGPNTKVSDYVGGEGEKPSWDAFFFYRHGQRFDANHARCPQTSAVLEEVDLCRIKAQAPEVCFSLLAPGSHIKPHYGVTNSRLVMHLPLKVPADCALSIVDAGEHHWQEGRLMMFDDTYQHEAWNRSGETRLILLMDCWNPHLAAEERLAITRLVECISDFENSF